MACVGIVIGAALRVRELTVNRSLWLDEALLANNVVDRSWSELLEPLDGGQGAPVGYLWLERALFLFGGRSELWLRSSSLAAGLVVLVLVWVFSRRVLSPMASSAAVLLVAASPGLVRYSAEMKQYQLEAAAVLILALACLAVVENGSPHRVAVLCVIGAVAIWFAYPALIALAASGLYLAIRWIRGRGDLRLVHLATLALAWLSSFALLASTSSLTVLASHEVFHRDWALGYPDTLRPDGVVSWFGRSAFDLLDHPGNLVLVPLGAALTAVGGAVLTARRRPAGWWMASLLTLIVIAATAESYPFRGRLALAYLPIFLIALAASVDLRSRLRFAPIALVVIIGSGTLWSSIRDAIEPTPFAQGREAINHVAQHRSAGDRVFVHDVAWGPFEFYGPSQGLRADRITAWHPLSACADQELEVEGTAWVIFVYTLSKRPDEEAVILRSQLASQGSLVHLAEFHDAFAALYDFDAPPDDPTGDRVRRTQSTGCLASLPWRDDVR